MPPLPPKPEPQEEKIDSGEEEETDTNLEDEDKELGKENVSEEEKGRDSNKEEATPISPSGNPKKRKVD